MTLTIELPGDLAARLEAAGVAADEARRHALAALAEVADRAPVGNVDLRGQKIDPAQAAELRARLAAFADDWNEPEMDVYDDYDAARSSLSAR